MKTIEIARKLAALDQKKKAQDAFSLALSTDTLSPEEELEAASYIFFSEGDHRIAFTTFVSLFNRGFFQAEIWDLMVQAFYLPNIQAQQKQYDLNCKKLAEYPYFFRTNFPAFEELPILFFPFDDKGFVPFDPQTNQFGEYINFNDTIVDRWFFKDLSKPILTTDLFSQYQLEYLNDTVRPSEWVAKENHIYLHYTDWIQFCTHLAVLDFSKLLKAKKLIFLFDEEISQYPFDFKARYGIDYSQNEVKPIGIREVNALIWHAQLSTDNGGDFFNEIFYGHPNLLTIDSLLLKDIDPYIESVRKRLRQGQKNTYTLRQLSHIKNPTDKDVLVAFFLNHENCFKYIKPDERIAPILFFQPHFTNIYYYIHMVNEKNKKSVLVSEEYDAIRNSLIFKEFKYIKTFVPMRRITTRYAANVRTMVNNSCILDEEERKKDTSTMPDAINMQLANRSYLIDPYDRLNRDSRLVRFEDGKLHPKATFTALAEFLNIPYTETMTYCSGPDGLNPESWAGNAIGFDTRTVYATYDEYTNDDERTYIEYFMRDAYEAYGYDFHYYKGEPVDEDWVREKNEHFTCLDQYIWNSWERSLQLRADVKMQVNGVDVEDENTPTISSMLSSSIQETMDSIHEQRLKYGLILLKNPYFINQYHQPLRPMTPLKLDPALLDGPAYH